MNKFWLEQSVMFKYKNVGHEDKDFKNCYCHNEKKPILWWLDVCHFQWTFKLFNNDIWKTFSSNLQGHKLIKDKWISCQMWF
jgi:hypothetical protein